MAEPDETARPSRRAAPGGAASRRRRSSARSTRSRSGSVRVQDLVLQSAVSILQLSARRIAKEDEKDLEQARIGIDAANAMIDHVPEEAQGELRQAVSELKMLFAQHSGGAAGSPRRRIPGDARGRARSGEAEAGARADSGLWTPGS